MQAAHNQQRIELQKSPESSAGATAHTKEVNMKKLLLCAAFATCLNAFDDQNKTILVHPFTIWKAASKVNLDKADVGLYHTGIYVGWTNVIGYVAYSVQKQKGETIQKHCLENVPIDQAIAMIDKYYDEHPEEWNKPLNEEIWKALTVKGSPCENAKTPVGEQ